MTNSRNVAFAAKATELGKKGKKCRMNYIKEAHTWIAHVARQQTTQAGYCSLTRAGYHPPNTGRILPAFEREERRREENGRQHLALIC
jgi:hypothetical protein